MLEERVFSGFCEWGGKEALAALLFGCPKYLGGQCVKQGGKKGKEKGKPKRGFTIHKK